MIEIECLDPVECRLPKRQSHFIEPAISYEAEYWRKGPHKMDRYTYDKTLWIRKNKDFYYFHTGLLERVLSYCKKKKIKTNMEQSSTAGGMEGWYIPPECEPKLPGITFREDQLKIMKAVVKYQRGQVISPTGSGKTVLQAGTLSQFPNVPAVILTHTSDIVIQTVDELKKWGFNPQQIGGGVKYSGNFWGEPVVSTIQSFNKLDPEDYCDKFGIVIVDEAHRVSSFEGMYANVLGNLLAPIRLGYTATKPTTKNAQMALEALIGPMITELTINQAAKKGILAMPKIKLHKLPFNHDIREQRSFASVYQRGVVENVERNEMIVDIALTHKEKNEVVLIFVEKIEHGDNIQDIFHEHGIVVPLIQGSMKPIQRKNIKMSMIKRRRQIAIATTAWKEGINIPSLNAVIMAGGGKDDKGVLQNIGRGLRRAEGKSRVIIHDFFDPSHFYLITHFGDRISLYMKMGWFD